MNNCFLWIFDVQSFFIKDVKQVSSYEINDDEECSSKSLIYISNSNINAQEKDIIFLKENNVKVFVGVIENIENADNGGRVKWTILREETGRWRIFPMTPLWKNRRSAAGFCSA